MCDASNMESFSNIKNWIAEVKKCVKWEESDKLLLVNKSDLPEEDRVVKADMLEEFSKETGVRYMETSAKSGKGVTEAFGELS